MSCAAALPSLCWEFTPYVYNITICPIYGFNAKLNTFQNEVSQIKLTLEVGRSNIFPQEHLLRFIEFRCPKKVDTVSENLFFKKFEENKWLRSCYKV